MKQPVHPKLSFYKKALFILVPILLIFGIFYFIKDGKDRHRFAVNKTEVENIYSESIKPLGVYDYTTVYKDYKPVFVGDGFWQSLACIDQSCPQISERWIISVNPDEQKELLGSIAEKNGYVVDDITDVCSGEVKYCTIFASKKGFKLSISLDEVNSNGLPMAAEGKVWRSIGIEAVLRPQELGI